MMIELSARLLKERTGKDFTIWNARIKREHIKDEKSLRAWLAREGVTGYAQSLLVWERFGYPAFMLASAGELIDAQYADRSQLRPILEAILGAASALGDVTVQARRTYVSLMTPRRTFARIQPTTKTRIDLGLRLAGRQRNPRLGPSKIHETMPVQVSLTSRAEVDDEVLDLLQQAYEQNF
jgi:hypothetical protein